MGNQQSAPRQQRPWTYAPGNELNQQLVERLRELELQSKQRRQEQPVSNITTEKDYVMVDEKQGILPALSSCILSL